MTTIKIGTDLKIGEEVFIAKKVAVSTACDVCNSTGSIMLGTCMDGAKIYSCPCCKGKGVIFSNVKKYVPVEGTCTVKEIRVVVKTDEEMVVRAKVATDGLTTLKQASEVFRTLEECQAWCDEKNQPRVTIPISEIVISDIFKAHTPSFEKINAKMEAYKRTGQMSEISIDKNNVLVDGYISYKLCQLLDIKEVTAKVVGD